MRIRFLFAILLVFFIIFVLFYSNKKKIISGIKYSYKLNLFSLKLKMNEIVLKKWIILLYIVLIIIVYIFILKGKLNILALKNTSDRDLIREILLFIITSEIAIFSIIISFNFFLFTFIQNKFRNTFLEFKKNIRVVEPFIITTISVLIGIHSLLQLNYYWINNSVLLLYNIILMIILIMFFILIIMEGLKTPYRKDPFVNRVKKISFFDIELLRHRDLNSDSMMLEKLENNNILVVRKFLINYLIEEDLINYRIIINCVEDKVKYLLTNEIGHQGITEREVLNSLVTIYYKPFKTAVDMDNTGAINHIFENIENIHYFCANRKYEWHLYIEFDEFISEMLVRCVFLNDNKLFRLWFMKILKIQNYILKYNAPLEKEIGLFYYINDIDYPDHEKLKDNHWDYISTNYLRMLEKCIDKIIEQKNSELLTTCFFDLFHEFYKLEDIFKSEFLLDLYLQNLLWLIEAKMNDAIYLNIFNDLDSFYFVNDFALRIIIKRNKNYSNRFLIQLISMNKELLEKKVRTLKIIDALLGAYRMYKEEGLNIEVFKVIVDKIYEIKDFIGNIRDDELLAKINYIIELNIKYYSKNNDNEKSVILNR